MGCVPKGQGLVPKNIANQSNTISVTATYID